ncbi:MAG: hypothetical protein KBA11_09555 [Sedimentibacter sp.]|jgi:hypothetical protein|nr:hypothetical protein [Sedimentibacter sp.]
MGLALNFNEKVFFISCRDDFDVAGDFGRRRKDDIAGDFGRRCECVFECLFELLEDAFEDRRCRRRNFVSPDVGFDSRRRCDCDCVFECLLELLEAAEDDRRCCSRRF